MRKLRFRLIPHRRGRRERGQSMVEMALTFPILLLVMAGTLEVGKYFNDQLTLLDATREAARFAADSDPNSAYVVPAYSPGCSTPAGVRPDYYHQAACLVLQNLYGIRFDPTVDDIVVSAMTIDSAGHVEYRFPYPCPSPYILPEGYPPLCDGDVDRLDRGWSFCEHVTQHPEVPTPETKIDGVEYHGACQQATSSFPRDRIEELLPDDTSGAGMGLVVVEIYHVHHQFLGLIPPGLPFLPQEVVMHAYTMMPVPSVAPPAGY